MFSARRTYSGLANISSPVYSRPCHLSIALNTLFAPIAALVGLISIANAHDLKLHKTKVF